MLCNALYGISSILLRYANNVDKTMQVPGIFIQVIFYEYVRICPLHYRFDFEA